MSWWGGKRDAAASGGAPCPASSALEVNRLWFGMALGVAVVLLLWSAPAALAAPPVNDLFGDAKALSPGLPVETTGTTVEATKEDGEPSPAASAFAATGLSVWFEWEATSTGFVTVGTCGSQTSTALGVYTGTAVNALTEVAGDFASLGPDCTTFRGTAVTFKAISGATYKILIEGRPTFPEEASFGQGPFVLNLDATPLPPNDDFADATVLDGQTLGNGVYVASASGFSWNATKEPGEPAHAGDSGGASVWYSWTAPSSNTFGLSACGRFGALLGVYTGDSLATLSQKASDGRGCGVIAFPAIAGTTYYLAIDGRLDAVSGAAAMGTLSLNISLGPPSPRAPPSPPTVEYDVSRPSTTIRKRVLRRKPPVWILSFDSNEPGSTFRCKLDKSAFHNCRSPRRVVPTAKGRHVLRVVAVDKAGNADLTPALVRFGIAGKPQARH